MSSTACTHRRVVKLRVKPSLASKADGGSGLPEQALQPSKSHDISVDAHSGNPCPLQQQQRRELDVPCTSHISLPAEAKPAQTVQAQPPGKKPMQRKRKADCLDDARTPPKAKQARGLFQTSIAAPLRRARRSLICMSKVRRIAGYDCNNHALSL